MIEQRRRVLKEIRKILNKKLRSKIRIRSFLESTFPLTGTPIVDMLRNGSNTDVNMVRAYVEFL